MSFLQALVMGLLQGATEFLPVSSSGHLAIVESLWHIDERARLALAAVLHVGTAVALLGYFGRRIGNIVAGLWSPERAARGRSWLTVGQIAAGTVPAAAVGLLLDDRVDAAFSNPALVGVMLLVTGGFLFATRFAKERGRSVGWTAVFVIGLAQAVAILPGISRSGATIAAALFLGLTRADAFEFSFLLSVPVILGAAVKEMAGFDYALVGPGPVAVGVLLALASGLGALVLLRRLVMGRRLYWFAFYCWLVGVLAVAFVRGAPA